MNDSSSFSNKEKSEILMDIINKIEKYYINESKILDIKNKLLEKERRGIYDSIASKTEFLSQVTEDLQKISMDFHFYVELQEQENLQNEEKSEENEIGTQNEILQIRYSYNNGNLLEIKRLPGNIGYILLTEFPSIQLFGSKILNALKFLKDTYSLIFDVRFNGGGEGEFVKFLISCFIDGEETLLLSLENRFKNSVTQSWALPFTGYKDLEKKIYVLTSRRSASAAEDFSYTMKNLKRATIVGERTRGAANNPEILKIKNGVQLWLPVGQPINPITKSNWEKEGVLPDIHVKQEDALKTALFHAINIQLQENLHPICKEMLKFEKGYLEAYYDSLDFSKVSLDKYIGNYGSLKIIKRDNSLFLKTKGILRKIYSKDLKLFYISEEKRFYYNFEKEKTSIIFELRDFENKFSYIKKD
jgi:hypothetical protein